MFFTSSNLPLSLKQKSFSDTFSVLCSNFIFAFQGLQSAYVFLVVFFSNSVIPCSADIQTNLELIFLYSTQKISKLKLDSKFCLLKLCSQITWKYPTKALSEFNVSEKWDRNWYCMQKLSSAALSQKKKKAITMKISVHPILKVLVLLP